MITKKATVGFILIAILVFPTAYFSWSAPIPENRVKSLDLKQFKHLDNSVWTDTIYRPPIVQFEKPLDMAIAVMGIIELFTLLCYLGLKRIEPLIKEWEDAERERVTQESES